jgi:hypothetical protein
MASAAGSGGRAGSGCGPPMSIITGRAVPKDRRTRGEVSAKSALPDRWPAPAAPARGRIRFERFVLDLDRGCLLADGAEVAQRPKSFGLLVCACSGATTATSP